MTASGRFTSAACCWGAWTSATTSSEPRCVTHVAGLRCYLCSRLLIIEQRNPNVDVKRVRACGCRHNGFGPFDLHPPSNADLRMDPEILTVVVDDAAVSLDPHNVRVFIEFVGDRADMGDLPD